MWGGGVRRRVDLTQQGRGGGVGLEGAVVGGPSGAMIGDGRASRTCH